MRTPDVFQNENQPSRPAKPEYGPQGAHGFDLSLFRANLRLTPTQRIEQLQQAILLYQEVRRAGRTARLSRDAGPSRSTAPKTSFT